MAGEAPLNLKIRLCLYYLSDGSTHCFANSLCEDLVDEFHRQNLACGLKSSIVKAELAVVDGGKREKAEAS